MVRDGIWWLLDPVNWFWGFLLGVAVVGFWWSRPR